MLIFVDESGIHKSVDHSTFVLVYIQVASYSKVEKKIIKIEKSLKIDFFHWSQSTWKVKRFFLLKILDLDFKVKIAVVKNPTNPSQEMEKILEHLIIERNIAKVFIDGKKPSWYERKIKKLLRQKNMTVRKLKTVSSKSCAGIRLADAIAGLSRWHFDGKNSAKIKGIYKKLEKKVILIMQ